MKFALLGIDDEALRLVREIARSDRHQLRYFSPATELPSAQSQIAEVRRLCPLTEVLADWELLLAPGACDVVILAGPLGEAGRFEQQRRLVQEKIPTFVTHPPAVSLLEAYELEMVRQAVRGPLWSLLLPWRDQIWDAEWFPQANNAEIASIRCAPFDQLTCQRSIVSGSRESVLAHLARDLLFIRELCGEISQVATLGGMAGSAMPAGQDLSTLTVQMSTQRRVLVRWNAEPAAVEGMRLTLSGPQRKHVVEIVERGGADTTSYAIVEHDTLSAKQGEVESPQRLSFVADTVQAENEAGGDTSNWPDAIRSLELIEAVEKSLKKGRTIAVGVEGRSETDAFKGTMASIGCVLLMVGLLVVVGSAVVLKLAQQTGNQTLVSIFRWWPALLVVLFGVFIIMQLLRFIIPRPRDRD